MFAVVDIAGIQYKVQEKDTLYVPKLDVEAGKKVKLSKVLLLSGDSKIKIGQPYIEGKTVSAKVIEHIKDDKVLVFKKKRRKGYKRLRGHRQQLTKIEIEKIK
jgi:large subunit ribosomal protein L21